MLHEIQPPRRCLSEREHALLTAIAEAALPAGRVFPAAGAAAVDRVDGFLARSSAVVRQGYRALLAAVESGALWNHRRSFHRLPEAERLALLEGWRHGGITRRLGLRGLLTPLKMAHFYSPDFYKAIGCAYEFDTPKTLVQPRYMTERVHRAAEVDADVELEVDAVVFGSGAGGAVVAKELAEAGCAVVILEEGDYVDRRHFNGHTLGMQRLMYRDQGATFSIGNVGIPIPVGRTVGGSTTVNSGTCFRTPGRVLAKWRSEYGLSELTDDHMAPYFDKVEGILGVAPARSDYLGGAARVIARGAERLGYRHGPLRRNAPECDGKGVCCFGCPTEAKRSTNVSYVPLALKAGAELFPGAKVQRILTEGGRAVGVVARTEAAAGASRTITVRARAVVVSCGTFHTPVLLSMNGLCGSSGELGGNLSIHPALGLLAEFDEDISGYNAIPQGYSIDQFHDEGILFEGGSMPLDIGMSVIPHLGPRLIELAERFDKVAMFGFMIEDSSRGRVRTLRGRPVITYMLNDHDVARLKRGAEILSRVFFAAGASSVLPLINGFDELRSEADLTRLRRTSLHARDFEPTAYHPLGTARMGSDPRRSVVGPDHQAHDVRGLYVVDGSVMPSSVAVNPQVTIMAMATRAAEKIASALS